MLGEVVGAPWVINPLLGALAVVVVFYLGKTIYDERTARIAALLASVSPFLIFMSSEFYNHATSLLFSTLFVWFFALALHGVKLSTGPIPAEPSGPISSNPIPPSVPPCDTS